METTLQALTLRSRRPTNGLVAAVAVAAALVAAVLVGAALRRETIPEPARYVPEPLPPEQCPGRRGCEFSPLAAAPSMVDVYSAWARREGPPTTLPALPPGWEGIRRPADREFLRAALDAAARAEPEPRRRRLAGADDTVLELLGDTVRGLALEERTGHLGDTAPTAAVRYETLLARAWAHELDRRRREVQDANTRARAEAGLAAAAYERALDAASWPRAWEWALLAGGVLLVVGAAAHRQVAYPPVRVDAHAVSAGRRRWLWEDVAEVRWLPDHVELVDRDGVLARVGGLDLVEHELQTLYALSDRLLVERDAGSATAQERERLAALIGRVGA